MKHLALLLLILTTTFYAQNENSKWYFGKKAGLDFLATPPAILTGSMNTTETAASISDALGNLLFYTDGVTIYNKQHQVMANGTGLLGHKSTYQGALIIRKPGSQNFYYVFTLDEITNPNGLQFSIVDMTLAAGNGSVVSKNNFLYSPSTEKLTAARHCNGEDFWVVTHEWNTNNFRSYLLTSNGIINGPVISSAGLVHGGALINCYGQMKISPNCKRLGLAKGPDAEVFDFDNSTGTVSNNLTLLTGQTNFFAICEFSPDNTKFYLGAAGRLLQYDLGAGTTTAVIASQNTITTLAGGNLQLAIDGKIYTMSNGNMYAMSVINKPNLFGVACGFSVNMQSVGSNTVGNPPNMINLNYNSSSTFSYSGNCQSVTFSVSPTLQVNHPCATYVGATKWDFGDGNSAGSNTSTVLNPSHFYSAPGTYTAMLVVASPGRSDTVRQQVVVTGISPSFSVSGKISVCAGEQLVLTAAGAYSYSWSSGATTSSALVKPAQTQTYTVTAKDGSCSTTKTHSVAVNPCLGVAGYNQKAANVYPNPFGSWLKVQAEEHCIIEILDVNGKTVLKKVLQEKESEVSTQYIAPGVYLVKMSGDQWRWQGKFVKAGQD